MKKLISCVTAAAMTVTMLMPGGVWADVMKQPTSGYIQGEAFKADAAYDSTANIRIDQKEIDIKDIGKPAPIYVRMDAVASGLDSFDFGVTIDERCTYKAITDSFDAEDLGDENLSIEPLISQKESFNWISWYDSEPTTRAMRLALFMVTVPPDAKAGDTYEIRFSEKNSAGLTAAFARNEQENISYSLSGIDGWIKIEGEAAADPQTDPMEQPNVAEVFKYEYTYQNNGEGSDKNYFADDSRPFNLLHFTLGHISRANLISANIGKKQERLISMMKSGTFYFVAFYFVIDIEDRV